METNSKLNNFLLLAGLNAPCADLVTGMNSLHLAFELYLQNHVRLD